MNKLKLLILSALSITSLTAQAGDTYYNSYIGSELGVMNVSYKGNAGKDYAERFKSGSIFAGFGLTDGIALELGYLRTSQENKSSKRGPIDVSSKTQLSGFYTDLMFDNKLSHKFNLLSSMGLANLKADTKGSVGTLTPADSEDGIALRFGIGAEYEMTRNFNLRGMMRHTTIDSDTAKSSLNYTIGATYKF